MLPKRHLVLPSGDYPILRRVEFRQSGGREEGRRGVVEASREHEGVDRRQSRPVLEEERGRSSNFLDGSDRDWIDTGEKSELLAAS